MADRPTLTTITSGRYSASVLNTNFQAIRDMFDNLLGINGTDGDNNTMTGDLDMGGNTIRNATFDGDIAGVDWEGPWVTSTAYVVNDLVSNSGNVYICIVAHTSGTFATDLAAAKWQLFASKGDAGAGSGDMLKTENLSGLANYTTARSNLGLGTAAVLNVGTGANQIVQLDSSARLPAVDGSLLTNVTGSGLPAGFGPLPYSGSSVPTGWLECTGAAVSRTTYADLFAAIGTTWGAGDGSTTFNIPNMSRRVAVGRGGSGTATLANTLGSTGGAETHTLVTAELAAHTHAASGSLITAFGGGSNVISAATSELEYNSAANTGSAGSGTAHNNMQPSAVVMMLIKT